MGASFWYNITPYQPDVLKAFRQLQEKVLAEGDYYGDEIHEMMEFSTIEELAEAKDGEDFWEVGTHSVLDMHTIGTANEPGVVVALSPEQTRELLGSERPTRDDFLSRYKQEAVGHVERWTGRMAVLFQGDQPHELAFWGVSGD
jgi:hypothetical protein